MGLASFQLGTGSTAVAGQLLATQELRAGAKPDIRVRIRALVVEVQRRKAGIAAIVAIAAPDREPLNARAFHLSSLSFRGSLSLGCLLFHPLHPSTKVAADLVVVA